MLYYNTEIQKGLPTNNRNLVELIFRKRKKNHQNCNKLNIITGFIAPSVCDELINLNFDEINVYIGYNTKKGFTKTKHDALEKIQTDNKSINFYYCREKIHSKIYIWQNNEEIIEYAIGSANFSEVLFKKHEETLFLKKNINDQSLIDYKKIVEKISFNISEIIPEEDNYVYSDNLTLLASSSSGTQTNILGIGQLRGEPNAASGLNWGYSNGLPGLGDAYIAIKKDFIKTNGTNLIPPKSDGENIPIDVVWDDNVTMRLLLEGNSDLFINGEKQTFPKQISTHKNKHELGAYLRKRISKKINQNLIFTDEEIDYVSDFKKSSTMSLKPKLKDYTNKVKSLNDSIKSKFITRDILEKYGRFDIKISKNEEDNTYLFDFSV